MKATDLVAGERVTLRLSNMTHVKAFTDARDGVQVITPTRRFKMDGVFVTVDYATLDKPCIEVKVSADLKDKSSQMLVALPGYYGAMGGQHDRGLYEYHDGNKAEIEASLLAFAEAHGGKVEVPSETAEKADMKPHAILGRAQARSGASMAGDYAINSGIPAQRVHHGRGVRTDIINKVSSGRVPA